ncbi:CLUMA_CG010021, isoform A [Clunio marinus]|uniref:CLUMA_CG010021, isoform A n=1 Tax=Clunio marinus TaxID=568069 RepID=A0A1J1I8F1_9DIPT|nr:CLUMA_CG010021, isoform A [Clunio marinus]
MENNSNVNESFSTTTDNVKDTMKLDRAEIIEEMLSNISSPLNVTNNLYHSQQSWITTASTIIPLYSVIFLLAVIGNSLVILTLVQNKRMRTITNLFLLNLAVSDLFLGVFCMPFTLVGMLLRDFIFGELMCKLLPYLQAKNNIEVYISNGGTRSRCSQTCKSSPKYNANDTQSSFHQLHNCSHDSTLVKNESMRVHMPGLRRSNAEKSLLNKKRVIKMLFVVVLEFFICWTPLYVINTITLFDHKIIYQNLGYTAISFFQLLAYSSSCCNPITYCFMNIGFRKAFLNLFRCLRQPNEPTRRVSLSAYTCNNAQPTTIPTSISINNTGNNNNNSLLITNSGSDCYDLSRQQSFNIPRKDNININEIRCDASSGINNLKIND